jgi:hypothetical protein
MRRLLDFQASPGNWRHRLPHAAQILQVTRKIHDLDTRR